MTKLNKKFKYERLLEQTGVTNVLICNCDHANPVQCKWDPNDVENRLWNSTCLKLLHIVHKRRIRCLPEIQDDLVLLVLISRCWVEKAHQVWAFLMVCQL